MGSNDNDVEGSDKGSCKGSKQYETITTGDGVKEEIEDVDCFFMKQHHIIKSEKSYSITVLTSMA